MIKLVGTPEVQAEIGKALDKSEGYNEYKNDMSEVMKKIRDIIEPENKELFFKLDEVIGMGLAIHTDTAYMLGLTNGFSNRIA